jgi:hypothetical protein
MRAQTTCSSCGGTLLVEEVSLTRDNGKTWIRQRIYRCLSQRHKGGCPAQTEDVAEIPAPRTDWAPKGEVHYG